MRRFRIEGRDRLGRGLDALASEQEPLVQDLGLQFERFGALVVGQQRGGMVPVTEYVQTAGRVEVGVGVISHHVAYIRRLRVGGQTSYGDYKLAALRRARWLATVVRLAQVLEQKRRLRLRESST